jgi:hypothetical protein
MINKVINNTINSATQTLFESKDKILTVAKKRANEEINTFQNKIPSPSALETQLKSLQNTTPTGDIQKGLLEAEKVFNNNINNINKVIKKLEDSKNELSSIKSKIDNIKTKIVFLDNIDGIITPIIDLAQPLVDVVINTALAANSSTLANGLNINRLGEQKKELKDLIQKGLDSLISVPDISTFFNKEISALEIPINKGISGLDKSIQFLRELKQQILTIYRAFISEIIISQLDNEDNDNGILGNEPLNDYIKGEDNLSTIISDVLQRSPGVGNGNNPEDSLAGLPTSLVFKKFK